MKKGAFFLWFLFSVYLVIMSYLLFIRPKGGLWDAHNVGDLNNEINLVLFQTIHMYLEESGSFPLWNVLVNVLGNVIVFLPFGYLISALMKRSFIEKVIYGFFFSLLIENMQLYLHIGRMDIDDVFLNTIGSTLGVILFTWQKWAYQKKVGNTI